MTTAPAHTERLSPARTIGTRLLAALTSTTAISVLGAFAAVAVLLLLIGHNPFAVFGTLAEGSLTGRGLVTTVTRAIPLIGIAIGLVFAFRAGVFNLGGEGQFQFGALVGVTVALTMPGPGLLVLLTALVAAALGGALIALIPAAIQVRLGPSVLITSLLLNYIVLALISWAVSLMRPAGSSEQATDTVRDDARLTALVPAQSDLGAQLGASLGRDDLFVMFTRGITWSIVVVIAFIAFAAFYNRRLPTGFESGVVGLNAHFARNVGIRSDRTVLSSMMIAGAMAGTVGAMLVLGVSGRLVDGELSSTGYAMTAVLVVMLARNTVLGTVVAGFFFSALTVGGESLNRVHGLPPSISDIVQALVIFFVVLGLAIPYVTARLRQRSEALSLGVPAHTAATPEKVEAAATSRDENTTTDEVGR